MAAYDNGSLSKYNSLTDRHLVSYFSNDRMRQHLVRNGLITKNGEVVPDAVYRVKMARREHRRRVRDLIAQAIIHKALEMERSRQIDIRKKIEEIAKIELVRRVREDRNRLGDEDCLSYFQPGNMDIPSRKAKIKKRADSDNDEYRLPATPDEKSRLRLRKLLPTDEIESKHLSQLDSLTLGEYSKILLKQDRQRINKLPYLGLGKSVTGKRQKKAKKKSKKNAKPATENVSEEPPQSSRSNQSKIQSMTKLSILFHAPAPNRPFDVMVEQQPNGGNTLILYRDSLTDKSIFTVTSHRNKGFPFSMTFFIDNVKDSRVSTCCEYKHKVGKRIGGPNGHFSVFSVEGANPCFRCLTEQDLKNERKPSGKKNAKSNDQEANKHASISVDGDSPYNSEKEFESMSSSASSDSENDYNEDADENYDQDKWDNEQDDEKSLEIEVKSESIRENEASPKVEDNKNNNAVESHSDSRNKETIENQSEKPQVESNLSDTEQNLESTIIRVTCTRKVKENESDKNNEMKQSERNADAPDQNVKDSKKPTSENQNSKIDKNEKPVVNNKVNTETKDSLKDHSKEKIEKDEAIIKEKEQHSEDFKGKLENVPSVSEHEPKKSTVNNKIEIEAQVKAEIKEDEENKKEIENPPKVESYEAATKGDPSSSESESESEEEEENSAKFYPLPSGKIVKPVNNESSEDEYSDGKDHKSVKPVEVISPKIDKNNRKPKPNVRNKSGYKIHEYSSNEDYDEDDQFSSSSFVSSSNDLLPAENLQNNKTYDTSKKTKTPNANEDLKIKIPNDDNDSNRPLSSDGNDNASNPQNPEKSIINKTEDDIAIAHERAQSASSDSVTSDEESVSIRNFPVKKQTETESSGSAHDNLTDTMPTEEIYVENEDISFKKAKEIINKFTDARIKSIKISSCELPSYVFNFISEKLELHSELLSIELSECEVEISLLNLLAKSLNKWPNLEHLILSKNQFVDFSMQNLIDQMTFLYQKDKIPNTHQKNLKTFDLSNCLVKENDLGLVIKMISLDTRVENILLDGNEITPQHLREICEALKMNSHAKLVSLTNCEISQPMIDQLVEFDKTVTMRLKI